MIGFDRPIRPEWIYEILKIMKIGDNPSNYNEAFADIAKQLIGKEGKRKARTVIYRSFIYSFQENRSKIENNLFFEWIKSCSLEEMEPLFLVKIIMDYKIVSSIIEKIKISVDSNNYISTKIITKKMTEEYGDKEIVKRSVRAFLKTLCSFKILEQKGMNKFSFLNSYSLSHEQTRKFIILYSKAYLKSNYVDLNDIYPSLLYFFKEIPLHSTAKKFNGRDWEYIRERQRDIVILK